MRPLAWGLLLLALVTPLARAAPARTGKGPAGPVKGDERVVFHTTRGDIVFGLFDEVAPRHAAQIRALVRLGVYDTSSVFRVEPGYLAQITDAPNRKTPLTSEQRKAIAPSRPNSPS